MEFCWKFHEKIELKVVLFGLMLSLLVLNGVKSQCNEVYEEVLEEGQTRYIYNDEYPDRYEGKKHCTWKIRSSIITKITCSIELNGDCNVNQFLVNYTGGSLSIYCGYYEFVSEGFNPTIQLISKYNYSQGRFLCEIKTDTNDDTCQCGWKKMTRIVGGKETGVNEYPMMAGLVDFYKEDIFCGATIISPRFVLTAAHCVYKRGTNEIGVVVGEHDTAKGSDTNATKLFGLFKYIIHPEYQPDEHAYNDVAVCQIVGSIIYSPEVGPACLPFRHRQRPIANTIATALGWGLLAFGGSKSTTLQKVDLDVTTNERCKLDYNNASNQSNFCTYTPRKDTCQMDSGGPLLEWNPATYRFTLVGIITAGIGCASRTSAIAMRVGYYTDWIKYVTTGEQYCQVE